MKNFFILQFTLVLLTLNGNIAAMNRATKLAYKKHRTHRIPLTINNEHRIDNSQEINNKDNENKQEAYIVNNTYGNIHEDKMAFYKQWQQSK